MGQIFSWIRGTRDQPALQDVAVEEQQSQQVTPNTQVSTAKPAQYEKGQSQLSAGAATVKPGSTPASQASPSVASSTARAAGGGGPKTAQKAPSDATSQATASKPTPLNTSTGPAGRTGGTGVKPTDPAKDKAQSTSAPSSKPGPAKVEPAIGKPSADAVKQTSAQKVQVEVGPKVGAKASKEDADPFDALSDTLPSSQPVAPKVPKFTGPEVKEEKLSSEKGVLCGERDDSLPPGYRKEDLEKKKPAGVPEKPKDVPKPISTDDALDSLSAGFLSSAPAAPNKTDVKTETVRAVDARANFAPPPSSQQKQSVTSQTATGNKSSAPPADKKPKMEIPTQATKPNESDFMSPDALSALEDSLGAPEPPKKSPELKPGQIVDEKKVKSEKGVRVGERDDTLPPDYRFSEEELKKHPPPQKEPSLNTDDALDILSEGFTVPAAAPVVKASVPPAQVFSAGPKITTPGPPQKPQTDEDAFSALGDTLGAPELPKKLPDLKPGDIVHEKDVTSEKGVRVGERDDTLPPNYRFSEEDLKKYPPPQKEPSLDPTDALDILSGDFTTPSATKTPVCPSSKTPAKSSGSASDFALDALAGDFVASSSASTVQSAVSGPPHTDRKLSESTSSALDALSDTLADIKAAPEPAPVPPKAIVTEKKVVEERVSKPGETDDSLPPDHRFSEQERKAFEAAKQKDVKPKQTPIDDSAALDLLSSDFSAVPLVKPTEKDAKCFTPEPTPPTFKASGPVLDELAEKVIPNLTDPKAKDTKAKGKGAKPKSKPKKQTVEDSSATVQLPAKPSSDVVPSSSTKAGNR